MSDRGSGGRNKIESSSELESYLFLIKDPLVRRSLCCFRISSRPLQIERGRYHRPTPLPANQDIAHCAYEEKWK